MRSMVPSLTVQPLLENAIGHGIENIPGGGEVVVEGTCEEGVIRLVVRNPAPPYDELRGARAGHGIALENIRERLALLYGAASGVEAGLEKGEFIVRLRFPQTADSPERLL